MQNAETVVTAFTIAAGLSLGIERTLELLKHFMESGNGSLSPAERNTAVNRAADLVDGAEAALKQSDTGVVPPAAAKPAQPDIAMPTSASSPALAGAELAEKHPPPRIPVIPMTPLSTQDTANALFFQFAAAGLGIIVASIFNLHLLSLLSPLWQSGNVSAVAALTDTLFTGLVIGGGSQPIHVLIRFLTERRITVADEEAVESVGAAEQEVEKDRALAKVISSGRLVAAQKEPQPLAWIDIFYRGGVAPEHLDDQRLRSGDPNLVIYHHTAMSSVSSFPAVVDESAIDNKWSTGYHCVIMPDGGIRPLCRWDRSGNHALGLNDRSLGLAFHGNFHTEPGRYANADGRFGNQRPTEAQLHAGARVVALWAYLYRDIALDFDKCIVPHKQAVPGHSACPGSNFPYEGFEQLVRQYHDAWSHAETARRGVEAFKKLPYVYA